MIRYLIFLAECGERLIDPVIAMQDEDVVQAIKDGSLDNLILALENNF